MTTVRPGRPTDRPALEQIQQQTLAEPWPELLAAALAGPPPLFVRDDGDPIGYAIVVPADATAYVPELAVRPDRQGEGHGGALLEHVLTAFDDRDEIRLTVRAVDERAQAFYRDHGFEQIDRLPNQFESGDGLLLVRR